jgi:predicted nucleic acid-binding protein
LITAVDTNVLLDLFVNDPKYGSASKDSLRTCLSEGTLIVCEVVVAEVGAFFASELEAETALNRLGLVFSGVDIAVALSASRFWKKYRKRGGRRVRILPDFLIGAHAMRHAERLLSRDYTFFHRYFPGLTVLDPAKNS